MSFILEAKEVHKSYLVGGKPTEVLHGIDLGFYPGEFAAIIGRSGSGKSTLLHILSGLDRKRPDQKFFQDVVDALGIGALLKKYPDQLSGGEQQRVAIARSLMAQPQLIFADEPTGNLDKKTSTQVLELLTQTASRFGQTVILVTHDLEIASTAQRVVQIEDGRVI